jgi:3-methyladenine DNA glycosylase AlkD
VEALRAALAEGAVPGKAPAMQAYMKSAMPFLGMAAPQRRAAVAQVVARWAAAPSAADLRETVLALWRGASHREHRYAALDLLRLPRHRKLVDASWLPALHEMLLSGPWWDHNDEISGLSLGLVLQRDPAVIKPVLRDWARSDHLWLRRAAMLCQRSLKTGFDAALLYDCIEPSLAPSPLAREFFIRKGMGWALRERARTAPEEVQAFCDAQRDRLSPLTLREALSARRTSSCAPASPSPAAAPAPPPGPTREPRPRRAASR